ncbi:MAG: acylneuraminate cytidylyltransferase family protein [Deltaproteobacteria bacterium]|nr:acylneuraminate cytidylyltransferase family protein [Deltaproteobacteria bacterium]
MFSSKRTLVVVPARGGSQGIPLKNLKIVGGRSLLARTGEVVSQLDFVDRAVCSTDHPRIAEEARAVGLETPFVRPQTLSGPLVSDAEVLEHALREVERQEGAEYDLVVMLQPTSPLRRAEDVTGTVKMLVEGGYDAVWTVSLTDPKHHPLKQLIIEGDALDYYDAEGAQIIARQQLTPVYHRNGVAYAISRGCLLERRSIKGSRTGAMIVEAPAISIDTESDCDFAEWILSRRSSR